MKTLLEMSFSRHSLTIAGASKASGIPYQSIYQHFKGTRRVSAEDAVRYERLLGIPRSELRPDLWPPEEEAHAPEQERAQGPAVSRAAAPAVPA